MRDSTTGEGGLDFGNFHLIFFQLRRGWSRFLKNITAEGREILGVYSVKTVKKHDFRVGLGAIYFFIFN